MEDGSRRGKEEPALAAGLSGSGGGGPITPMRVGLGHKRLLGWGNHGLFNPRHDLPSPSGSKSAIGCVDLAVQRRRASAAVSGGGGREEMGLNRVRVIGPRVFYMPSGAKAPEQIEPANLLLGWAAHWAVLSRVML
jgi:hypothetical protein